MHFHEVHTRLKNDEGSMSCTPVSTHDEVRCEGEDTRLAGVL